MFSKRAFSLFLAVLGICFWILSCTDSPAVVQPESFSDELKEERNTPRRLSGSDLNIWSKVDTTGEKGEVVQVLRTFFDQKMKKSSAAQQNFWIEAEYEQFVRDYSDIRYAEYGPDASVMYWPTLLGIETIAGLDKYYFALVRWASLDSLDGPDEVKFVFKFLVKPDQDGAIRLAAPTKQLTAQWRKEQVGDVTYVLSPKHVFSRKQAEEQGQKIKELQDFFEIDPFPITYYSFQYSTELLQTRGYVQHPMFYKFETGGQAGVGDVVYSGNDRDEYVHEVVHLFISRAIPQSTGLLNEGLATLIGGSSGYTYSWHKEKLKAWVAANPNADLTQHLNPYQSSYIEEDTSIPYTIGAVLCEKLLKDHGKEVLLNALRAGKDPWGFLEEYEVTKSGLRKLILE